MQVPERLALIGGSILLASTLIFTLKSQASSILPKISAPISSIYDHAGDAQQGSSFPSDFKDAQRNGDKTGDWGSSKYYIDKDGNMHIGAGQLQGNLYDLLGDDVQNIHTITLDENAQAPQSSYALFAGRNYHLGPDAQSNSSITAINGLDHLDVSRTVDTSDMFYRDLSLSNRMDLSNWNVSQVTNMRGMFGNTNIPSFNIANWDVRQNTGTGWMFYNDYNLGNLDLSGWHTDSLSYSNDMFAGAMNMQELNLQNFKTGNLDNHDFFGDDGQVYNGPTHSLNQLTLSNDARFGNNVSYFPGMSWKNNNDNNQLSNYHMNDGDVHPGTWTKAQ